MLKKDIKTKLYKAFISLYTIPDLQKIHAKILKTGRVIKKNVNRFVFHGL